MSMEPRNMNIHIKSMGNGYLNVIGKMDRRSIACRCESQHPLEPPTDPVREEDEPS